jgi:hypothetical protein
LLLVVKVPVVQSAQVRSEVEVPAAVTYSPPLQVVQVLQELAFVLVLKEPSLHAAQLRSAMVLPSLATCSPGAQVVLSTHSVPELPSWSQVPGSQAIFGAMSPAQKVPASHAVQTAAELDVPASVISVPAAHVSCGKHADKLVLGAYVPS